MTEFANSLLPRLQRRARQPCRRPVRNLSRFLAPEPAPLINTQGRYAEAEPLYRRALAIREKALGSEHPDTAQVLKNYAAMMRKLNRESEAAKLEARVKGIQEKSN